MRGRLGALAVLAALLASGCASAPPPSAPVAPDPQIGHDKGAITGVVLDDAQFPVPAVDVALIETHERARTDLRGRFTFDSLEPGSYRLVFRLIGYNSPPVTVDVAAQRITPVRYVMRTATIDPGDLRTTLHYKGLIQCSANPYYAVNPCGVAGNEDQDQFVFDVDAAHKPAELMLELAWKPAAAGTAKDLELDFCDAAPARTKDVVCFDHHYYRFQTMASPNVLRLHDVPFATYRSWLAGVGAGFQSSVVYGQTFDLYVTLCYYRECPGDYSAVPP